MSNHCDYLSRLSDYTFLTTQIVTGRTRVIIWNLVTLTTFLFVSVNFYEYPITYRLFSSMYTVFSTIIVKKVRVGLYIMKHNLMVTRISSHTMTFLP